MIEESHRAVQRRQGSLDAYHQPIPNRTPAWVNEAKKGRHRFVERQRWTAFGEDLGETVDETLDETHSATPRGF